jgi:hypothetical protein
MRERGTLICACACVLLLTAAAGAAATPMAPDGAAAKGDDILYHFDLRQRQIIQPVEPRDGPVEKRRFVKIEVTKVINPNRHFVGFEVRYRTQNEKEISLGTFSLYPPDNPGTFIVPTQGRVRRAGAIVLRLVLADKVDRADSLRVDVRRIEFVDK